jgi:uncharacterized membrane protein YeaQ/YmgE (transglycosylase-associated protein family)
VNITFEQLCILLVVGALAGWIAALILRGRGLGLVGNLVVGVIGSFLGNFLFKLVGFRATTSLATFLAALAGALALLWLIALVRPRRKKK